MTKEEFIEKSKAIHGNRYDYSRVNYKDNKTKVCIICPIHGEFWQRPNNHLSGQGCPYCGGTHKYTTEEFIKKAKEIHGDKYDYSKVKYSGWKNKVKIICPIHGEFEQIPFDHLRGHGCVKCMGDEISKNKTKPYTLFVEEALKKHNSKYTYDITTYVNRSVKMKINCPIHGEFWQTPHNHLSGQGCPYCNDSILEKEVEKILLENKINYINKCTSSKLKWLERQHLDFYLPDYKIAIECQGIQHFEPRERFGGKEEFVNTLERDKRKKEKCIENNINIIYYSSEYIRKKTNKNLLTKNNLIKYIKKCQDLK